MTAALVDAARVVTERDRILADPEFRPAPGWIETWVLPVLQDLVAWFSGLGPVAHAAIIGGLSLALVALLVHLFVSLAGQVRSVADRAGVPRQDDAPEVRGAGELAARAREALGAARFTEAVRLAWLAAVAALDAAGVSPGRASRADWEHVADARRLRPAAAPEVESLAAEFQRVRFGGAPVDAAAASRCLQVLERLQAGMGRHG